MALTMSGCQGDRETIIEEPIDDIQLAALTTSAQEASYQSPGYYAPNAVMNQDAPTVPAPATPDDILAAAASASAREQAQSASIFAPDMARGNINVGIVMDAEADINPIRCVYQDMMNLSTQVFEGLVVLDENQHPIPQLADRWEANGNIWTITLRNGIQFHDGSRLSPEDVVASYEEVKRNPSSYWYPAMGMIRDMTVVNENTIRITSATTGYMTLYALTFPVVSRSSLNADVLQGHFPLGTGPYLIAQYSPGNAIRLEINPIWWKHSNGQVKSIVGLFFRTNQLAIKAMETMEIDTLVTEYPTASISRNLNDRTTKDYSTLTYECIVPNLGNPILRETSVREALMYAIDRAELARTVYTGMVQESEVPVVPGTWLYEPQAARYTYNPERALKILYDAGWVNNNGTLARMVDGQYVNLKLRLYTADRGTTSTRSEACAAIKEQLKLVGINVEITRMSHTDLRANLQERKFDLALCAFELSEIPNLHFLLNSQGVSNFSRYNSGEMDQYLRNALDAPTEEELVTQMSYIQMKCVNDLPVLGLFFHSGVLSSRAPLNGVVNPRRGYVFGDIATGGILE